MSPLIEILLLSLLGSVFALIGGVLFLYTPSVKSALLQYSVPFAAGVLLTTAVMGMLPEAVHVIGEQAYLILILSFFSVYLFDTLGTKIHHHEEGHHHSEPKRTVKQSSTIMVMIGDSIHNFVDGVAIAASFIINPGLGLMTAISTFLHEVPHEIGDFGVLLNAGWKKRDVLLVNIASSLVTIIGALSVLYLFSDETIIGYLLSIAAGMFIYIGASDFLPSPGSAASSKKAAVWSIVGAAIMICIYFLVPHEHPHEDHLESDAHEQHSH